MTSPSFPAVSSYKRSFASVLRPSVLGPLFLSFAYLSVTFLSGSIACASPTQTTPLPSSDGVSNGSVTNNSGSSDSGSSDGSASDGLSDDDLSSESIANDRIAYDRLLNDDIVTDDPAPLAPGAKTIETDVLKRDVLETNVPTVDDPGVTETTPLHWRTMGEPLYRTLSLKDRKIHELDISFGPNAVVFQVRPVAPEHSQVFVAVAITDSVFPCQEEKVWLSFSHVEKKARLPLEKPLCQNGFLYLYTSPEQSAALEKILKAIPPEELPTLRLTQGKRVLTLAPPTSTRTATTTPSPETTSLEGVRGQAAWKAFDSALP